jgi:membrane protein required for colicin V production
MDTITGFDYVVFTIIGLSTLFAVCRGFIKTTVSLIGWIVAMAITYVTLPYIKPMVIEHFHPIADSPQEMLINMLTPSAVFMVVLIIIAIINYQIVALAAPIRGGTIDRSLGFVLGVARGMLFACLLFIMIEMLSPMLNKNKDKEQVDSSKTNIAAPAGEWLHKSQSYSLLKMGSEIIISFFPPSIQENIAKMVQPQQSEMSRKVQMETLTKIIAVLPKDALPSIKTPEGKEMSDSERDALIRQVLEAYNSQVKEGSVDKEMLIPEEQIKALERLAPEKPKGEAPAGEAGYDAKERREIDRLIKTVK